MLDPGPLATKWFHSFEGGGESFVSKSFFVASQGGSPVVAGSWRTTITLPSGEQLPTKGDGTDADIIAAKFAP